MKNSTVLAAAMAFGLAFHAQAKLYTPVFTQSFDSAETYTANFYDGSVASDILGTSESDPGTAITGAIDQKQRYGATEGEMFCFHNKTDKTGTNRALYKFPSSVTGLSDYKLEFDYYLSPGVGTDTRHSALVIKGSNGVIATFDKPAGGENGRVTYNCNLIYGEGSSCTNTFSTGGRGTDPSDSTWAPYWLHVTIYGNATDGLFLSVVQDSGAVVLSDIRVGNFQTVDRLFFYVNYSRSNDYAKIFALDNVVCSSGANQTFIWTGAEEDNKWSTPGNWMVGDEVQTENYPMPGDTVSGVDASVLAALDVAVKLDSTGDVTRFVNFADKSLKTWVAQGADTRWTTLANWVYTQGGFTVYETPARGDTLTFPASLSAGTEVSFNADEDSGSSDNGYALVVDGNVAFVSTTAAQRLLYSVKSISGSGVLSLENVVVRTMTSKTLAIDCNLSANGSSGLYLRGSGANVTFSGALSGTGTLKLDADTNSNHSFTMTGDMSGFAGTLEIPRVIRNNAAGCSYSFNGDDSTIDLSGATVSIADPMTMTLGGTYTDKTLKIGALTGAGTIRNNTSDAMTLTLGNDETDAESSVVLAVKDGTGAWTVAKTGSNTQVLSDTTVAFNVSVEEGTLALPVGKSLGTIAANGGRLEFAAEESWTDGASHLLFTYAGSLPAGEVADYVYANNAALGGSYLPTYDTASEGSVSVAFTKASMVWVGAEGGLCSDAANWQVNGAAAENAPTVNDTVTIPDGAVILVDPTQEFGAVTAGDDVTLKVLFTDDALTFAVPESLTAATLVAMGPYTATLDEGVMTATRVPSVFTWTGAEGVVWGTPANWTVAGAVSVVLPGAEDTVVFPESEADWSVTLTKDVTVKGFVVNQAISLSGAHVMVAGQEVRSDLDVAPTVTLGDDAGLCATTEDNAKLTVNVPLCITASEGHTAYVAGRWVKSSVGGATITINEKVTGSGYLEVRGVRATLYLKGDLSEFTGHLSVPDDTSLAGAHRLTVTIAEGPNEAASWSVSGENNDGSATFTWPAGKTYKFGSFNGSLRLNTTQSNYLRQVLEIGAVEGSENSLSGDLFKNSYISLIGSWTSTADNSNRGHTIRKVGNSHMTFSAVHAKAFEINGGTFEVTRNESYYNTWTEKEATEPSIYNIKIGFKGQGGTLVMPEAVTFDPSASIIDSTAPISIDTATDRTWAVPLAASNVGGLVKKGAGTLTLSAIPKYTGVTTVEAGELVVPAETRIHWDILSAGALMGAQPTSYDYQVGTTNVYDSAAKVPSAGNNTLNLDNLVAIDLTSVTTVERNSKFVIAEAKAFNVDDKAITKAGRENIELIWGENTVFPEGKTAADYTLQVVNGQLVVANKAVGIAIIIK